MLDASSNRNPTDMSKYWVVAADSSEARLFTRDKKYGPLVEVDDWLHPESRLHGHELETDRPGKSFASHGQGQTDHDPTTEPKKQEAEAFAGEVADRLDKARGRGDFEHLQIVADPKFLGLLRERLDDNTRDLVDKEVDKNMTRHSPEQIAEALDSAD
jgi:protein required for attachment to host cells